MKKGNLTINDIARELGVSKSTISRALSDSHDISPETREKILEYIRVHDYRPDHTARSLRSKTNRTIGVIVPAYNIPFYSIAISGIQDFALGQGYNVMVCHSNEQYEVERKSLEALVAAGVEGIIISVSRDTWEDDHIRKLQKRGIPLVMFNRVIEEFKAAKVVVDDYYGAREMVDYLIRTGCRKIAHIAGPANLLLSANRREGYLDALKDHGLPQSEALMVEADFTLESGIRGMERLLKMNSGLDAVFCVCDAVAFGAMKVIRRAGLEIPGDISVAGFTNEPFCEVIEPALSTVAQPIYEIGESASRLLFSQLSNRDIPPEFCVLNTELIIRRSTR